MSLVRSTRDLARNRSGLFFIACLFFTVPLLSQEENRGPAVQRIYDHLSGTWTGTNHNYMTPIAVESRVDLHVKQDANGDWLDLEYLYTTPGKDKPSREVQQYALYLPAGVLVRDFISARSRAVGGLRMQLENFSTLMESGFGDFTARSAILWRGRRTTERIDYHLRPDHWSYEIYVNTDGSTWEKTGDWTLRRTATP